MVLKAAENQVRVMLADTILALCRNALPYRTNVNVEGLLGITMDDEEIFLININQKIHREGQESETERHEVDSDNMSDSNDSLGSSGDQGRHEDRRKRKKRKRNKIRSKGVEEHNKKMRNEFTDDSSLVDNDMKIDDRVKPSTSGCDVISDSGEVMFIKQEPSDSLYDHSQFGAQNEAVSQLQQLAFQISTDLNPPPLGLHVGQSSTSRSIADLESRPPDSDCYPLDLSTALKNPIWLHEIPKAQNTHHVIPKQEPSTLTAPQRGYVQHMIMRGDKYACKICGREYSSINNCRRHVKVHSGERPHKCSFCGRQFARKEVLKVHIRQHTGESPFHCQLCRRSFHQKAALLYHNRYNHPSLQDASSSTKVASPCNTNCPPAQTVENTESNITNDGTQRSTPTSTETSCDKSAQDTSS